MLQINSNLFKPRGMPLGHFNITIVNNCQHALSQIQAQRVTAVRKSFQQYTDYSDDSSLTTLTKTPDLSDREVSVPKSPSRASELSDTPKFDGSTSTGRRPRKRRRLQATGTGKSSAAINCNLTTISPFQNGQAPSKPSVDSGSSIIRRLPTENSPYQPKQDEVAAGPTQGCAALDAGMHSKESAHAAESDQPCRAEKVERPRRMAISEQEFDELRFRPMTQVPRSSDNAKAGLNNLGQGPKSEPQQQLKHSRQEPGSSTSTPVPYYKAERVFKWKVLERPGYDPTPKASGADGSQEFKTRGRRDRQKPQVTDAHQPQTGQLPHVQQRAGRDQQQSAQIQEPVLIPDDSDEDVKMEEPGQTTVQPETRLDPSTIRRLRDSGLLGRSRRR